jgi:hypothetical protein
MLLLVEHDHVMRTLRARQLLADLLSVLSPRQRCVVVFRSSLRRNVALLRTYPQNLRERIVVTPLTPRSSDLAFWLIYEISCTLAALRHAGVLGRTERWVVIASPEWTDALSRHVRPDSLVPVTGELNEDQFQRLRSTLGQRRAPSSGSAMARIPNSKVDRKAAGSSATARPTAIPSAISVLRQRLGRGAKTARVYRRSTRPNLNAS